MMSCCSTIKAIDQDVPEVRRLRAVLRAWRAWGRAQAALEACSPLSEEIPAAQAAVARARNRLVTLREWKKGRVKSGTGAGNPAKKRGGLGISPSSSPL